MAWPQDNEPRQMPPRIQPMEPTGDAAKGCLVAVGAVALLLVVGFIIAWAWP